MSTEPSWRNRRSSILTKLFVFLLVLSLFFFIFFVCMASTLRFILFSYAHLRTFITRGSCVTVWYIFSFIFFHSFAEDYFGFGCLALCWAFHLMMVMLCVFKLTPFRLMSSAEEVFSTRRVLRSFFCRFLFKTPVFVIRQFVFITRLRFKYIFIWFHSIFLHQFLWHFSLHSHRSVFIRPFFSVVLFVLFSFYRFLFFILFLSRPLPHFFSILRYLCFCYSHHVALLHKRKNQWPLITSNNLGSLLFHLCMRMAEYVCVCVSILVTAT